jgi:hypothetical protein
MPRSSSHFIVVAHLRAAAATLTRAADVLEAALDALRSAEPILSGSDHSGMSCGAELAQVRAALVEADRLSAVLGAEIGALLVLACLRAG